jgi:hypothetical protein
MGGKRLEGLPCSLAVTVCCTGSYLVSSPYLWEGRGGEGGEGEAVSLSIDEGIILDRFDSQTLTSSTHRL